MIHDDYFFALVQQDALQMLANAAKTSDDQVLFADWRHDTWEIC